MKVLLIAPHREPVNMPTLPFGLVCVATATKKKGHEVKLLDLINHPDPRRIIQQAIREFCPDIIGISVRNIDDQAMENTKFLLDEAKDVLRWCRKCCSVPIVLGGAGYSIFSASALRYLGADMGIRGEGEMAFPSLLENIARGKDSVGINGLYLPNLSKVSNLQNTSDLDTLPLPDEKLWDLSGYDKEKTWLPLQTKRGCPMDCNYCSTGSIEGKTLRMRSPGAVIQAIARHVKAGFRKFYFTDNIFNIPASYTREICQTILAHRLEISWMCILYPSAVEESLVHDMAKAGCKEVSLGFESGNGHILKVMHKQFTIKDVQKTSKLLKDYGIRQMGFLLLGGPGETKESANESFAFADSLPLDAVKITEGIRIYPDTELARIAVDEGIISPGDDLLYPRFYIAKGLENWLHHAVSLWLGKRRNWMI